MTYEIYGNRGVVTAVYEEEEFDIYDSCSMSAETFRNIKKAIVAWRENPINGCVGAEYWFDEDNGDFTWRFSMKINPESIEVSAQAYSDGKVDYSRGFEYIAGPRNDIEKLFMQFRV